MVLISLRILTQNPGQQDPVTQWCSLRLLGCGLTCPSGISKPTRSAPSWFWCQGREQNGVTQHTRTQHPRSPRCLGAHLAELTALCGDDQVHREWQTCVSQYRMQWRQGASYSRPFPSDPEMKPVAWLPSQAPPLTGQHTSLHTLPFLEFLFHAWLRV